MDYDHVKTHDDFTAFINQLNREFWQQDLELYLRSLYAVLEQHKTEPPSFPLFAQLFHQAFEVEPAPFDEAWRQYQESPDEDSDVTQGYYDYLSATLLYQIHDLHQSREYGVYEIESRILSMGYHSAFYHWSNWYTDLYLSGIAARSKFDDESEVITWKTLARYLRYGQFYE